jgi:hypothetical protein
VRSCQISLDLLMQTGLMAQILPEMLDTADPVLGRQDSIWHPEGSVWEHTKLVLLELMAQGASFELLLGGLLHDVAKPLTIEVELEPFDLGNGQITMRERITNYGHDAKGAVIAEAICRRLKLSGKQITRVSEIVRLHMKMHKYDDPAIRRSKLVRLLERDDIMDLIMMQHADARGTGRTEAQRASASLKGFYLAKREELANETTPSLKAGAVALVNGDLIKRFGFKPGPLFKVIIEAGFDAQHAGEFTDVAGAEAWLSQHAEEFRSGKSETLTQPEAVGSSAKRCC